MKIMEIISDADGRYNTSLVRCTQREYDNMVLYEGLIRSVPRQSLQPIIRRSFPYIKQYYVSSDGNIIAVIFRSSDFDNQKFNQFEQLINKLGWYIAVYYRNDDPSKKPLNYDDNRDKRSEVAFSIEPKFDETVDNIPEYLYHVTTSSAASKILQIGLIPKTHSKLSNHPDRIYLAVGENEAYDIADGLANHSNQPQTILKIDTSKLIRGTRFYKDPNFSEGDLPLGIYTLSNIPPQAISVFRERD